MSSATNLIPFTLTSLLDTSYESMFFNVEIQHEDKIWLLDELSGSKILNSFLSTPLVIILLCVQNHIQHSGFYS